MSVLFLIKSAECKDNIPNHELKVGQMIWDDNGPIKDSINAFYKRLEEAWPDIFERTCGCKYTIVEDESSR